MYDKRTTAHGGFKFRVEGSVLISDGVGPGSEDVVRKYISQVSPLIEQLKQAPWVSLTVLDGVPLSSPEAAVMLSQGVRVCVQNNMVACATVILNTEYMALTQNYWQSVHRPFHKLPFKIFTDVEEAKKWLSSYLT